MRQMGRCDRVGSGFRRNGFSLIELLAVLGLILILVGLLIPSLSQSKEQALELRCASEMRQLGMRIHLYTDENRGYVPFPYQIDRGTNEIVSPTGRRAPLAFAETGADYWAYSFIDEYPGRWLDDELLCPNDVVSAEGAQWVWDQSDLPPGETPLMLVRAISRAFYIRPEALHADFVQTGRPAFHLATLSDVSFPSAKAFLVEGLPFHDDYQLSETDEGLPIVSVPDALGRRMVAASDLSVELRAVRDAAPPALPSWSTPMPDHYPGTLEDYRRLQRNSVTFDYTRDGVLGRDW